jgi:hypothetical protein
MLGGAREFRYDWILLRARDLPHEAGARRPSCSPATRRATHCHQPLSEQLLPRCRFGVSLLLDFDQPVQAVADI